MSEEKKVLKKKKMVFSRTDSHKKKRVGKSWRRPKGIQNKRRLRKKGYAPVVKVGFRNQKEFRGSTKEGLKIIMVTNSSQLESIDKKTEAIIVSGRIGNKKRLPLLELAKKKDLKIVNLNVDKKIAQINKSLEDSKKKKEDTKKKQEEKTKKEKEKAKEKKKPVEDVIKDKKSDEDLKEDDKKDKEKKDYNKLLVKKQ
ncbi:MAG: eL32 family ribosomal protein [archaeon]